MANVYIYIYIYIYINVHFNKSTPHHTYKSKCNVCKIILQKMSVHIKFSFACLCWYFTERNTIDS